MPRTEDSLNGPAIPEDLIRLLRVCFHSNDPGCTETRDSHRWRISDSYCEWSGYHDEDRIETYTLTVTDQEPALEAGERRDVRPLNRDRWQGQLPGYPIAEYFETFSCGNERYDRINRSYIRLAGPSGPLWVIYECACT